MHVWFHDDTYLVVLETSQTCECALTVVFSCKPLRPLYPPDRREILPTIVFNISYLPKKSSRLRLYSLNNQNNCISRTKRIGEVRLVVLVVLLVPCAGM